MNCYNCGATISDTAVFCTKCGAKLECAIETPIIDEPTITQPTITTLKSDVPSPQPANQPQPAPAHVTHPSGYHDSRTVSVPSAYKPLSPWAYIGYQLLFSIPIVGLVCLIVFSCGASSNKNLTNFARSYWCALLIILIILIILFIISLILGVSMGSLVYGSRVQMY